MQLSVGQDTEVQVSDLMTFYENDARFATIGRDLIGNYTGSLITWEVGSKVPKISDKLNQNFADTQKVISFSPNGNYLVYTNKEGGNLSLQIWDTVKDQAYGGSLGSIDLKSDSPKVVAFSPDDTVMALSDGNKLSLYKFPSLERMGPELRVDSIVNGLGLVVDGKTVKYIFTLYDNGGTQIWDGANQTKIGSPMPGNLQFVGSNTLERMIYYIDPSNKLIKFIWNQDHEAWQDVLCRKAKRNFTQIEWQQYLPGKDYQSTCPDFPDGE